MTTPLIALLLVFLPAASVLLLRRERRRLERACPPVGGGLHLFNLRNGDIVQIHGRDWLVEERWLYKKLGGFQWLKYRLQHCSERCCLSVFEDKEMALSWLHPADLGELDNPEALHDAVPEHLRWAGRDYQRTQKGSATLRADGLDSKPRQRVCTFADYEAVGSADGPAALLSLEWWGSQGDLSGEIEMMVGEPLAPEGLRVLPRD